MGEIAARVQWGHDGAAESLSATLGRRLSNSDVVLHDAVLSGGRFCVLGLKSESHPRGQVAIDAGGQVAAIVDSRLQNADELTGHFKDGATSDAALILRAYQEWGPDLVRHLRGEFAGVVWDRRRGRIVGFRDELGIKALFYSVDFAGVTLASDVEVLLAISDDRGAPDDHLIVESLTWDYQSTERTFWSKLRRLNGGHVFEATADGIHVRRYWFPPEEIRPLTTDEVNARFKELFVDSVRRSLDSRAPTLAHLSGGADSSAIVCVADKIFREATTPLPPIHAVSARYPGLPCDEGSYIDAVTQSITLPFESWDGRSDDFTDLDRPSVAGPGLRAHRADGSGVEFTIAKRVGARVILSGAGGDHVGAPFGVAEERARRYPFRFVRETIGRTDLTRTQRVRRARFLLRAVAPRRLRAAIATHRARKRVPDWLQPRWRDLAADLSSGGRRPGSQKFPSRIQELRWRELTGPRTGLSLDADRRSASREGVEFRYPFLDRALVEFVLSLPCESWPFVANYARIQKAALACVLPAAVRDRTTKAEFSSIVAYRVKQSAGRLRSLFWTGSWASERWVNQAEARQLLDRALKGVTLSWSEWQALRAIGNLEAWLRDVFG